ncbi:hypothetical protein BZA77DRAFT_344023 [Pyronema omphalodes]|nr:hypothetical protein BZA77DRAFT_344023 [Pyronema omphalodes]
MADDKTKLSFLEKFCDAFNLKDHSDVTIKTETTEFHAHQVILKLRTSFFENATKEENGFSESKDKVVTIEEHNDDLGALKHCRVYALADFLGAPELKQLAAKKLSDAFSNKWVKADFPQIVHEVYATTNKQDEDIRGAVITSAKTHIQELLQMHDFKDVLLEVAEFSGGLIIGASNEVIQNTSKCRSCACVQRYNCNYCGHCHY